MTFVWTQFGAMERDALTVEDFVEEREQSRETVTIWRLAKPVSVVTTEPMVMVPDFGLPPVDVEAGKRLDLQVGQFMRGSAHVEMLMPQSMSGGQPKLG